MNVMVYAKHRRDRLYQPMNLDTGDIGVDTLSRCVVPVTDETAFKRTMSSLKKEYDDWSFEVRYLNSSRVYQI